MSVRAGEGARMEWPPGAPDVNNHAMSLHGTQFKVVTEDQLDNDEKLNNLVFVAQDIWHVQSRILKMVNKRHPNLFALRADMKRVFSQVGMNAERVQADSVQELEEAVNVASQRLREDLLGLLERWQVFQNKGLIQARDVETIAAAASVEAAAELAAESVAEPAAEPAAEVQSPQVWLPQPNFQARSGDMDNVEMAQMSQVCCSGPGLSQCQLVTSMHPNHASVSLQAVPNPAFGGTQEHGLGLLCDDVDTTFEPVWVPLKDRLKSVTTGPELDQALRMYSQESATPAAGSKEEALLWSRVPRDQLELVEQRTDAWHGLRRQYLVTGSTAFNLLLCACAPPRRKFGTANKVVKMPAYRKGTLP